MKLFKVAGDVLDLGSEVAAAVAADGDAGRKVTSAEAGRIAPKVVNLVLDLAPAADAETRKSLAAALRAAANKLEAA